MQGIYSTLNFTLAGLQKKNLIVRPNELYIYQRDIVVSNLGLNTKLKLNLNPFEFDLVLKSQTLT